MNIEAFAKIDDVEKLKEIVLTFITDFTNKEKNYQRNSYSHNKLGDALILTQITTAMSGNVCPVSSKLREVN